MANPQKENGYVPVANELVEAFARTRFHNEASRVLFALLRLTYGWQKKEAEINLNQLAVLTCLKKPNICRAIAELITMRVITKKDGKNGTVYGLQKNYEVWNRLQKGVGIIKPDNGQSLSNEITKQAQRRNSKGFRASVIKPDNEPLSNQITKQQKPNDNKASQVSIIKPDNGQPLSNEITTIIERDNKSLSNEITHITIGSKDNLKTRKKEPPLPPLKSTVSKSGNDKTEPLFEQIWKKYPNKVGKKEAFSHFRVSVKTEDDFNQINIALKNYLLSERVRKGFIQDAKTWFNNWKDWVEYTEVTNVSTGARRNIIDPGSRAAFERIDAKAKRELEDSLREESGGTDKESSKDSLF